MGLSKVYRGYVIEDVNGQWYIRNAPNFTNGFPFSPGPHGGWTVATRQVDKLIEYTNRSNSNSNSNRYSPPEYPDYQYSSSDSDPSFFELILFWVIFIGLGLAFKYGW